MCCLVFIIGGVGALLSVGNVGMVLIIGGEGVLLSIYYRGCRSVA